MIPPEFYERGVSFFSVLAGLSAGHRRLVADTGSCVQGERGATMFTVGDPCIGLTLLIDGCVRVSCVSAAGRELVLYRVRAGESCTINARCLIANEPYPATGVFEEETTALIVSKDTFHHLVGTSDVFRAFVLEIFTAQIDHLMQLVNHVAFEKLDVRIASRLIDLGPVVTKTHQELADEVGSSREMVSRILESFADQGLVSLGRKRIEIPDLDRFERTTLRG